MASTVIDIHPHVISKDDAKYPRAPLGGHQSDWSRLRPVTTEDMVVALKDAGVAKSALVQASTCYGHDNSYVADAVAKHPDLFTGVFSVDVLAPDGPEKIRYWMSRKLTGLRLFTTGSTMPNQADWLDDPKVFPAWETCSEAGIPICLQMSAPAIPQMINMAKRFPKVRIILDHLARPALDDGPPYAKAAPLWSAAQYPNVYLKLTQRGFTESRNGKATPETFFPKLVSEFGASRIAWGSNYPASEGSLKQLVQLARDSLTMLSDKDRDSILAMTAQSLYPALADK